MAELPQGGHLEHAAIAGHSGDIWAQSPSFPEISPDEASAILAGFDDQAGLAQKGLFIGGTKFIVIAGDEGVIRGQKGREGRYNLQGGEFKNQRAANSIGICKIVGHPNQYKIFSIVHP